VTTDVFQGVRALRRAPAFTIGAIATLALAIGANAAIFSAVRGVLLRQLPFREPDRVFWVWSDQAGRDRGPFNVPDFADYQDQNRTLRGLAGFFAASLNLGDGDSTERLQGIRATADAFEVLGVRAGLGRLLRRDDEQPGREHVVVLGRSLWQRRFGAADDVVGRGIRLDGESYTVVGVLPEEFAMPIREVDFAVPFVLSTDPRRQARNSVNFVIGVARLRDGVSRSQAEAELTSIARRLQQQFPVENARKRGVRLVGSLDGIVGSFRAMLVALQGGVLSVLGIACANLANLVLSRAAARRKETAVRIALGAPRWRVARQVLVETLLLSAAGGALGLLLAHSGVALLLRMAPTDLPRIDAIRVDLGVIAYTLLLAAGGGIAFGAIPALVSARMDPNAALRSGGRGATGGARGIRSALVACEVGLAFVLLVVVGLFGKSFAQVQGRAPGFESAGVLSARLALPSGRYDDREAIVRFQRTLEQGLAELPTVTRVGSVSVLPLSGLSVRIPFGVDGHPVERQDVPVAQLRFASPGYFEAMGIPLLRGRTFSEHDTEHTAPVAVVSESLARKWLAVNGGPIGTRLLADDNDREPRGVEVVGVVGDIRQMALDSDPTLDIYLPYPQIHPDTVGLAAGNMFLVARSTGQPMALAAALSREIRRVDADVAAANVRPLDSYLAGSLAPRRFSLVLLSVFGGAALLLALAGIHAVISYSVAQRAREIAIRMALGALAADVQRLVLAQGLRHAALGMAVAAPVALAVAHGLGASLADVAPADPATFAGVALALAAGTVLACAVPAVRAGRARELPTEE
jgi:putative ABC transport system permease protein